ncbi:helix-turn-helix domain-containing protein [Paenibacillus turicensis]|uniref:GH39 family glycosyl hydrolase n=1 Tax=Paenibacillus turicensis TaxID=160487 RepID=UPI003D270795
MNHTLTHIPYFPGCPAYFSFNESYAEQFHQHTGLEIIWVTQGKLKATLSMISSQDAQDYNLQSNDLLLINHLEPHRIIPLASDTQFIQVHLDSVFIAKFFPDLYNLYFDVRSFRNSIDNQSSYDIIRILVSQLFHIYRTQELVHNEFFTLVRYLTSHFTPSTLLKEGDPSTQNNNIVRQILNSVELDFKGKLTLNEIAQAQHYNSSYLSDIFRRNIGISFKTYLQQIRIRYSLYLLQTQHISIVDIALSSGFSDEKSYYKAIRQQFGVTPLQLRKQWKELITIQANSSNTSPSSIVGTINEDFLTRYAAKTIATEMLDENTLRITIDKDVDSEGTQLHAIWNKMMNIGSANTLLNQNMRDQITEMKEDIPIEYIRFEGIFNQEMDVLQKDKKGFKFNWKFVNQALDYLLEIEVKPFVCLSYMPLPFASKSTSFFNYQGNTSPPKEMGQWLSLVQSFLTNCINRYGLEQVSTWYFQIWTEFPVNDIHWSGTLEQYFELYKQTALLIKNISPIIKVGPAAENFHTQDQPSERLLKFCQSYGVPIDFYCCNIYHNRIDFLKWGEQSSTNPVDLQSIPFQYESKNHTKQRLMKTYHMLRRYYGEEIQFMVTRWNLSWDVTNPLHDTAFMATFIIDNMLDDAIEKASAIGFLSASDILYEWDMENKPFYGGTGLMNTDGIKKSAYYAFVFLSKLGETVIAKGKHYIITRKGDNIQILLYNPTYLNQLYERGEQEDRQIYNLFEETSDISVDLQLNNLYGTYKCKQYSLNRDHGSAYDEWVRMGEYVDLNEEETDYLKHISRPNLQIKQMTLQGEFQISVHIPVHGIECLTLKKLYN